jgi:hypothetical protein
MRAKAQLSGGRMASRRQEMHFSAGGAPVCIKWAVVMADARRGRCSREARMRLRSRAQTAVGILALLGMLALSSPGVRVARAGDGDAASSESCPADVESSCGSSACKVGDETEPRPDRSAVAARIAERLRAEMQSSDEKPIVLNGRGYNYRTARDPLREIETVETEAKRRPEQPPARR